MKTFSVGMLYTDLALIFFLQRYQKLLAGTCKVTTEWDDPYS